MRQSQAGGGTGRQDDNVTRHLKDGARTLKGDEVAHTLEEAGLEGVVVLVNAQGHQLVERQLRTVAQDRYA